MRRNQTENNKKIEDFKEQFNQFKIELTKQNLREKTKMNIHKRFMNENESNAKNQDIKTFNKKNSIQMSRSLIKAFNESMQPQRTSIRKEEKPSGVKRQSIKNNQQNCLIAPEQKIEKVIKAKTEQMEDKKCNINIKQQSNQSVRSFSKEDSQQYFIQKQQQRFTDDQKQNTKNSQIQIQKTHFSKLQAKYKKYFQQITQNNKKYEIKIAQAIEKQNNLMKTVQKKLKELQQISFLKSNQKQRFSPKSSAKTSNWTTYKDDNIQSAIQQLRSRYGFIQRQIETRANRDQTMKAILFVQQKTNKLAQQLLSVVQIASKSGVKRAQQKGQKNQFARNATTLKKRFNQIMNSSIRQHKGPAHSQMMIQ